MSRQLEARPELSGAQQLQASSSARLRGGGVLTESGALRREDPRLQARPPFLAKYGKFLLVGLTGVFVNLVVFAYTLDAISPSPTFNVVHSLLQAAFHRGGNPVDYLVAAAIAFTVATLWNFALNSVWTFRTATGHRHGLPQRLGLYYGVSLGSLAVNELVLFVLGFFLPPLVGQGVGIIGGSVVGFAGNYRVTFAEAALDSSIPRGAVSSLPTPLGAGSDPPGRVGAVDSELPGRVPPGGGL